MSMQDRLYMRAVLHDFPIEVASPFIFQNISDKDVLINEPDKFFLVGKHNETLFKESLDNLGLLVYNHRWESGNPSIQVVRGILHFPYVCTTRSLFENLALSNVYFLPSEEFLRDSLFNTPGYFWDRCREPLNDYHETEWYRAENQKLFVYYSSFEELKAISDSPDFDEMLADKKTTILKEVITRNVAARHRWKEILS